jgi:hypothetical protein
LPLSDSLYNTELFTEAPLKFMELSATKSRVKSKLNVPAEYDSTKNPCIGGIIFVVLLELATAIVKAEPAMYDVKVVPFQNFTLLLMTPEL